MGDSSTIRTQWESTILVNKWNKETGIFQGKKSKFELYFIYTQKSMEGKIRNCF